MSEWTYYRTDEKHRASISMRGYRVRGDDVQRHQKRWTTWCWGPEKVRHFCNPVPTEYEAIHGTPEHVDAPQSDDRQEKGAEACSEEKWTEIIKDHVRGFAAQRHRDEQKALLARFTAAALTGLLANGDVHNVSDGAVEYARSTLAAFNTEIEQK